MRRVVAFLVFSFVAFVVISEALADSYTSAAIHAATAPTSSPITAHRPTGATTTTGR